MIRFFVFLSLGFAICAAARSETLTYGVVGNQGSEWILLIAREKGFLAARDVQPDMISAPSSAAVQQQVAAGSIEVGTGGLLDPIRAIDKGADLALIRTTTTPAPYALLAKPALKTFADLRGKIISVGGAQDVTRFYLQRMLTPSGVRPGDYDLVYAGATAARFASLQSGAVDAALLTSPFNFRAETAGFVNLGLVPDYVTDIPFSGISVNRSWGLKHKPLLVRFLAAYQQAVAWFYDPANHGEAVTLLATASKTDPADADKTYAFYQQIKAYDLDGTPRPGDIGQIVQLLRNVGQLEGTPDVGRFIDPELSVLAKDAK